jgi:hypothetical protein
VIVFRWILARSPQACISTGRKTTALGELGVYSRREAMKTLDFIERVVEEMTVPIQIMQTDRGLEFFAEKV